MTIFCTYHSKVVLVSLKMRVSALIGSKSIDTVFEKEDLVTKFLSFSSILSFTSFCKFLVKSDSAFLMRS